MDDLIERCERANGPDRELDQRIFGVAYGWNYPLHGAAFHEFNDADRRYTASLDAALALVERVLPGARWKTGRDREGVCYASVNGPRISEGATPALALVAATLRAIASRKPTP